MIKYFITIKNGVVSFIEGVNEACDSLARALNINKLVVKILSPLLILFNVSIIFPILGVLWFINYRGSRELVKEIIDEARWM